MKKIKVIDMNAKDLVKGKEYLYTAGAEPVRVVYMRETLNGYVFTDGRRENELSYLTLRRFVEDGGELDNNNKE